MIYSNLFTNYREKKISSWLLVVFLLFFSIFIFINQFKRMAISSRANVNQIKRIEITNLTPYEATVYWQTNKEAIGWLVYGEKEDSLTKIAYDIRDTLGIRRKYFQHYILLKDLLPGKSYYFNIISDNKKITQLNNRSFTLTTPQEMKAKTKIDPGLGKVVENNLQPLENGVVLLYINDNIIPLSSLTKETGEWLIPLNYFIYKNTLEEIVLTGEERARLEIISEKGEVSKIDIKLKDLSLKNETIIIGKDYNYLDKGEILSSTTYSNSSSSLTNNKYLEIIYPIENAYIPGNKPLIKGRTLSFKEVFIKIVSLTSPQKTYSGKVVSNNQGEWRFLIDEPLPRGKYNLVVEVFKNKNEIVQRKRSFTITANDAIEGRVLGTATGEPTIVYSTPTSVPTSTIVFQSTTAPTKNIITPTIIKTGILNSLFFILGVGFFVLGTGIFILF